jgi:hypothetical protein
VKREKLKKAKSLINEWCGDGLKSPPTRAWVTAELEREKVREIGRKRKNNANSENDIGGLQICGDNSAVSTSTGSNHCASIENKKEKAKDVVKEPLLQTQVRVSTHIFLINEFLVFHSSVKFVVSTFPVLLV